MATAQNLSNLANEELVLSLQIDNRKRLPQQPTA